MFKFLHNLFTQEVVKKDCWDVAIQIILPCIRAGYKCEIWTGKKPGTIAHAEACIIDDNGDRVWLRESSKYNVVIDRNYKPRNFEPIIRYEATRFFELVYTEPDPSEDEEFEKW